MSTLTSATITEASTVQDILLLLLHDLILLAQSKLLSAESAKIVFKSLEIWEGFYIIF